MTWHFQWHGIVKKLHWHWRHGIKILSKISSKSYKKKYRPQFWKNPEIPACAPPDRYLEDAHAGIFIFFQNCALYFFYRILHKFIAPGILEKFALKCFLKANIKSVLNRVLNCEFIICWIIQTLIICSWKLENTYFSLKKLHPKNAVFWGFSGLNDEI